MSYFLVGIVCFWVGACFGVLLMLFRPECYGKSGEEGGVDPSYVTAAYREWREQRLAAEGKR
jgi:hypothetical protein